MSVAVRKPKGEKPDSHTLRESEPLAYLLSPRRDARFLTPGHERGAPDRPVDRSSQASRAGR